MCILSIPSTCAPGSPRLSASITSHNARHCSEISDAQVVVTCHDFQVTHGYTGVNEVKCQTCTRYYRDNVPIQLQRSSSIEPHFLEQTPSDYRRYDQYPSHPSTHRRNQPHTFTKLQEERPKAFIQPQSSDEMYHRQCPHSQYPHHHPHYHPHHYPHHQLPPPKRAADKEVNTVLDDTLQKNSELEMENDLSKATNLKLMKENASLMERCAELLKQNASLIQKFH